MPQPRSAQALPEPLVAEKAPLAVDAKDLEANAFAAATWAGMAKQIPHQAQQVLISWIFIAASIMLFLDFVGLQTLVRCLDPEAGCGIFDKYIIGLDNWFGTVSCVWWFSGFVVLQHWLARIGATKYGQFACLMKLVASIFFNLQPMTGVAGTRHGAGLAWSNLTGVLLFHSGNLLSTADFFFYPPPGSNKLGGWLEFGNLPVTGNWVYQLATWFLLAANLITCDWTGDASSQWLPTAHWAVKICQYAGSLLLLMGSIIYCSWCDGFRSLALN